MKRILKTGLPLLLAALLLILPGCNGAGVDAVMDALEELDAFVEETLPETPDTSDPQVQQPTEIEAPEEPEVPEVPEEPDNGELPEAPSADAVSMPEDGSYTSAEDVALYIYTYGRLPDNFITKKEAQKLGWSGGSLEPYAPGKCIGGSHFGNYEGILPEAEGREWTECDIDTLGADSRGAKRIVFSNDGLIYYTEDHYETFTLLYGEEN